MYKSLNDASEIIPILSEGTTEIYYWKDALKYICGPKHSDVIENFKNDFVLLGKISGKNKEKIFDALQSFNWSPNGEAYEFIVSKNLSHTSMSVGDIIRIDGTYYLCESIGWSIINII